MNIKMLAAITLNGKIAKNSNEFVDWTGNADKKYFMQQTLESDVVIMGSNTYDTLNAPLFNRVLVVMTSDKNRIYNNTNTDVIFVNESPKKIISDLRKNGFENIIIAGGSKIYSLFLKEDLIDEIHLTVVPKIFENGIDLCRNINKNCKLKLMHTLTDNNIVLIYDVIRNI